jgi:hypothetical protein
MIHVKIKKQENISDFGRSRRLLSADNYDLEDHELWL